MKKSNLFLSCLMILISIMSCNPEPELPVPLHGELEKGSFPRLLNFDGKFDINDVDDSNINWEVEFYDEDNGSCVEEYSWAVQYKSNSGGGNNIPIPFVTIPKSNFGINAESGLPTSSVSWTMNEILEALSLTINDINGCTQFNFFATLKRDDGKEFTTVNTGDNIESSSPFSGFFRFTIDVVGSLNLAGKMNYSTIGWCGETWDGEVEWIDEGNGVYNLTGGIGGTGHDFSFGAYAACYGGLADGLPNDASGDLRFMESCNKLGYQGESQWDEAYYIRDLITDGDKLTVDWFNDYEPEAGVTTFTRQDGKDWPPLTF